MSAPLVSVIVPNYRHAPFLPERLASILGQTEQDIEVILLDDASGDGSVDILKACAEQDGRVTDVLVNQVNSGSPFGQWRKGIAKARGTWVWVAESDDSCAPDLLERLLAVNRAHGDSLGLVYAQSMMIDANGKELGSWVRHTSCFDPDPFEQDMVLDGPAFVRRFLKVRNVIPNASAVIFRRELVRDEAIWDNTESMRMLGDWLVWCRLVGGSKVGFVADPINLFRDHAAISRRHTTFEQKRTRLYEEGVLRSELSKWPDLDQQKELDKLYSDWVRIHPWYSIFSKAFDAVRVTGTKRSTFITTVMRELFVPDLRG